jgi:transcriptional regulator with XRE-family HTH domain
MPPLIEARRKRVRKFDYKIGLRIRQLRLQQKIPLEELSESADMSPSHLSRVENGERSLTLRQAENLARRLGIKIGELVHGTTK